MKRAGSDDALRCSFCHKSQDVVGKLISSPSDYPRAYICDECIAVCNSILEDDKVEPPSGTRQQDSQAAGSEGVSGSVRDRAGGHQEEAGGGGVQPLQAHPHEPDAQHRGGAAEVQYPADRPHRHRQDVDGADSGQDPRCAVRHRGRHHPDRSRLRGRGCREHHPEAAAGGRRRCAEVPAGHHLHRRNRQDLPQGREPVDHPRCFRAKACSRRC